MSFYGKCLSYPIRPDQRGTLAILSQPESIVLQSILSIVETRQGERPMLPDYGLADYVFSTIDAGFAKRVAQNIKQQIYRYEPLVELLEVRVGIGEQGTFTSVLIVEPHRAVIDIRYQIRGSNVFHNLTFPARRLIERERIAV